MKELENKQALNEEEVEKVAGGILHIFPPFEPEEEDMAIDLNDHPWDDPYYEPARAGRPLPFPQDRQGNKAPLETPHKAP